LEVITNWWSGSIPLLSIEPLTFALGRRDAVHRIPFLALLLTATIVAADDGSVVLERSFHIDLGLSGIQYEGHLDATVKFVFKDSYSAGPTLGVTYKPRGTHSVSLWVAAYWFLDLEWGASFTYSNSRASWGLGPTIGLGQCSFLWGLQGYWRRFGIRVYLGRWFIEYPDDIWGVAFINRTGIAVYYRLKLKKVSMRISSSDKKSN
jgi:hypothetical protein